MDTAHLNTVLLAIVGFFMGRVLKKVDDIDSSTKSISMDVAIIKADRQLIWDKIKQMEDDLEELKRLVKAG
jgi:uncharacterized protein YoxC